MGGNQLMIAADSFRGRYRQGYETARPIAARHPQRFVPNIFWAKPGDFQKATRRLYYGAGQASFVELPLAR